MGHLRDLSNASLVTLLSVAGLLAGCTAGDGGQTTFGVPTSAGGVSATEGADAASAGSESAGGSETDGSSNGNSGPSDSAETSSASANETDSGTSGGSDSASETEASSSEASTGDSASSSGEETGGAESSSGGGPTSDDPFDPSACVGAPWTAADASGALGGMLRQELASATIQVRSRTCPGGACGEWGANADWEIHYLTWSGGVTTRWKDLQADMDLILFDDGGGPRLSMQHETFGAGGYPDDDGIVYDFPPVTATYPHLRAYNVAPDFEYDYIDLDYQVSDGQLILGDGCAVWTANPFGAGMPHLEQFGALFRW